MATRDSYVLYLQYAEADVNRLMQRDIDAIMGKHKQNIIKECNICKSEYVGEDDICPQCE